MFGIGSTELLVILLVALVVLGPKSLSGMSRTLGKALGEFRRVSTEFQRTLNAEVDQSAEEERRKAAAAATPAPAPAADAAQPPRQETAAPRTAQEYTQTPAPAQPQTGQQAAVQQAAAQPQQSSIPSFDAVPQPPAPPADSPLAQALAKARAEAEGAAPTPTSKNTGGAA